MTEETTTLQTTLEPVRIIISPKEHERIKAYTEQHHGRSISREIREVLKGNADELCDYIERLIDTSNPEIIDRKGKSVKQHSTAIYLTESTKRIFDYVVERLSPRMPLIGRSRSRERGQKTFILKIIIDDILSKGELSPNKEKPKRAKKNVVAVSVRNTVIEGMDGNPEGTREKKPKGRTPQGLVSFSFRVRELFLSELPTATAIQELARKREVTIAELYHQAIKRFSGLIVPEPPSIATKLVIARIPPADYEAAKEIAPKCKCDAGLIIKSSGYTDEEKILLTNRMKRHKATLADVFRSAIYEELSQHYINHLASERRGEPIIKSL
jgi:hypothetical protein